MTRPIVIVGDVLLDVDVIADADRLMPEAPVPVLRERERRPRPGGAGLAAALAARSTARPVVLLAAIADDEEGELLRRLLPDNVRVVPIACRGRTPVKTRLRANGQTVTRLDSACGDLTLGDVPVEAAEPLRDAAAVLVSDYGAGTTRHPDVRALLARRSADHQPLVWDPHPRGAEPVPGTSLVTPNAAEAATASGITGEGIAVRRRQAQALREMWAAHAVAVTLGSQGALLSYGDGAAELFPAEHVLVVDTCGAGDAFAAAATLALADGALPSEAVALGTGVAARFVAAGGAAHALDDAGGTSRDRAFAGVPAEVAAEVAAETRARGGTVVATGGCFDLLHAGHVATLAAARALGDCLIVCVNSDDSVRRLKGDDRPIQPIEDRVRLLAALRHVDAVVPFEEDTPAEALRTLRPDVWVKGGDYAAADLPEADLVRSWGGEVVTVPYLAGRSTSHLVGLARR